MGSILIAAAILLIYNSQLYCYVTFFTFGCRGGPMTKSDPTDVQVNILEKTKKKIGKNFSFLGNGNVLMEKTKKKTKKKLAKISHFRETGMCLWKKLKKKRKKNWQKFLIFRKRECAYGKN